MYDFVPSIRKTSNKKQYSSHKHRRRSPFIYLLSHDENSIFSHRRYFSQKPPATTFPLFVHTDKKILILVSHSVNAAANDNMLMYSAGPHTRVSRTYFFRVISSTERKKEAENGSGTGRDKGRKKTTGGNRKELKNFITHWYSFNARPVMYTRVWCTYAIYNRSFMRKYVLLLSSESSMVVVWLWFFFIFSSVYKSNEKDFFSNCAALPRIAK